MLFAVHLKQSRFWSSADVKPKSNYPEQAMPWQGTFSFSMCTL